ncbi:hypothetical protein NDU88_004952 [Pleurodeles waltl]|uniref:Uncharacterized protein n=1 Tax=Pleurodeles waltl TaxID=8319 RepID=A0AAV7NLA6_PLEWA|nr:hypothetical protein NDU88_004952 [Pleurodeles waltl]
MGGSRPPGLYPRGRAPGQGRSPGTLPLGQGFIGLQATGIHRRARSRLPRGSRRSLNPLRSPSAMRSARSHPSRVHRVAAVIFFSLPGIGRISARAWDAGSSFVCRLQPAERVAEATLRAVTRKCPRGTSNRRDPTGSVNFWVLEEVLAHQERETRAEDARMTAKRREATQEDNKEARKEKTQQQSNRGRTESPRGAQKQQRARRRRRTRRRKTEDPEVGT